MARVFSIPLFLILFLIGMKFLCGPTHAHAATGDGNSTLWKSIQDYEDKYSFEQYGPPLPQNRVRFESEERLYEAMVQNFDLTAEDEYDFTFIVQAYDVPVDVFRPEVIRPGDPVKESADNPFGEDDPLPEAVSSTSAYVEEIRPTFLPGGPLKQRSMGEVKLSEDQQGSLFSEKPVAPPAPVAAVPGQPNAASPLPGTKAGATDVPKKFDTDADTLANLKAAVKQLGLERQLNLDPKNQRMGSGVDNAPPTPGQTATPTPPVPATQTQAPATAPATPPALAVATPQPAVQQAKPKKKTHAVKKKKRRAVHKKMPEDGYSDDGVVTDPAPASSAPAEDNGGSGFSDDDN